MSTGHRHAFCRSRDIEVPYAIRLINTILWHDIGWGKEYRRLIAKEPHFTLMHKPRWASNEALNLSANNSVFYFYVNFQNICSMTRFRGPHSLLSTSPEYYTRHIIKSWEIRSLQLCLLHWVDSTALTLTHRLASRWQFELFSIAVRVLRRRTIPSAPKSGRYHLIRDDDLLLSRQAQHASRSVILGLDYT